MEKISGYHRLNSCKPFQKSVRFAKDSWRGWLVNDENLEKYEPLIEYLTQIGQERREQRRASCPWRGFCTQNRILFRFRGMRSSKRLAENAKAAEIVLTESELARIDELAGHARTE